MGLILLATQMIKRTTPDLSQATCWLIQFFPWVSNLPVPNTSYLDAIRQNPQSRSQFLFSLLDILSRLPRTTKQYLVLLDFLQLLGF